MNQGYHNLRYSDNLQGKKYYVQAEYSEEVNYAVLDWDLHFHSKSVAAETYKNKYFYASTLTSDSPYHYAYSYEFEKVGWKDLWKLLMHILLLGNHRNQWSCQHR